MRSMKEGKVLEVDGIPSMKIRRKSTERMDVGDV